MNLVSSRSRVQISLEADFLEDFFNFFFFLPFFGPGFQRHGGMGVVSKWGLFAIPF